MLIYPSISIKAQFLCDNEFNVINKQKKAIRKHAEFQVKDWYTKNAFRHQLPETLKFEKIQIKNEEDKGELKKWSSIDSLLCLNKGEEFNIQAMKKMSALKLAAYEIKTYFNFKHSSNPSIRSLLYFNFDINGDLLLVVIREKENSPYTEKYYR